MTHGFVAGAPVDEGFPDGGVSLYDRCRQLFRLRHRPDRLLRESGEIKFEIN